MKHFIALIGTLLLAACVAEKPVTIEPEVAESGAILQVQEYDRPVVEEVDPDHGESALFAIGPLAGADGTSANGMAQAMRFTDGFFRLSLQLNIEPAPAGFYYEGWIQGDEGRAKSVGTLRNQFGDVRHYLTFEAMEDFSAYRMVVISREQTGDGPEPMLPVAKGTMEVRPRE